MFSIATIVGAESRQKHFPGAPVSQVETLLTKKALRSEIEYQHIRQVFWDASCHRKSTLFYILMWYRGSHRGNRRQTARTSVALADGHHSKQRVSTAMPTKFHIVMVLALQVPRFSRGHTPHMAGCVHGDGRGTLREKTTRSSTAMDTGCSMTTSTSIAAAI